MNKQTKLNIGYINSLAALLNSEA